jgi:glycosyltransferase involved in cell wall biosynthesis
VPLAAEGSSPASHARPSVGTPGHIGMVLYELGYGGVERQAELLAQAAKEEGYQVTLIVLAGIGPAAPRFAPICDELTILDCNVHSDRSLHQELLDAVTGKNWDAALIFSTAKIAVISHALKKVTSRQAVYVGNPVPSDWLSYLKQQFRAWRYPPAGDLVFLACSHYVEQSLQRDRFFRKFRHGVSWNCVQVPNQTFEARTSPFYLAQANEGIVGVNYGMVARLDRIKDQATLIEAAAILQREGFAAELHLVGQGDEENRLRELAKQRNVQVDPPLTPGPSPPRREGRAFVHFEGVTANVFAAMANWDIFVFSTTKDEGFGAAAAEAMAFGMPCIFTDVGPCREVGGDAVLYVPEKSPQAWAQAVKTLAQDDALRTRLAQAARERAGRLFTKKRMWQEYRQALGLPGA